MTPEEIEAKAKEVANSYIDPNLPNESLYDDIYSAVLIFSIWMQEQKDKEIEALNTTIKALFDIIVTLEESLNVVTKQKPSKTFKERLEEKLMLNKK